MKASIDTSSVKVILDTNALMVPEQFGVDIFSELLRLGYAAVAGPGLCPGRASLAGKARPTKEGIRLPPAWHWAWPRGCNAVGEDNYDADQAIEELALETGAAVFTNDKALKKRLFSKGITVVYLRQGQYLEATKKEY